MLQQAEVVVYDRLVARELIALLPESCQRIYVEALRHSQPAAGRNQRAAGAPGPAATPVVRLKGGDPFIFGRGAEELERLLEAGVDCQVVPGVTAASGCRYLRRHPADPPRPRPVLHLRHRPPAERRPPRPRLGRPGAVASRPWCSTWAWSNLAEIAARLVEHGLASDTPAALVKPGAPRRA
ncbi:uroporphyrinogen-III C-methyltransferase [Pseudomonas aeruginosa]